MKTLVVDDSSTMRRIVRQALEIRLGCRVWEAGGCEEALAAVDEEGPFALVLTDLHMPGGGGEGLIRALRARPGGRETAVLVISVEPTHGNGVEGLLRAGADGFLGKPFRLDELVAAVRGILPEAGAGSPPSASPT